MRDILDLGTFVSDTVAIRHDPRGNVVILVTDIAGPIDFGAGPVSPPASASSARAAGLAKYAPDGSLLWGIVLSGEPTAELPEAGASGAAMTVDSRGNILLSLNVGGRLVLDGVTMTTGEHLLKLNPEGHALWALRLPTRAREVAVDRRDRIAITGTLEGATGTGFDFGEGPITGADFHAFVARYSSRGELDWVFVDDVVARPEALTADEQGNFYFGGTRFPEIPGEAGTPYLRKVSRAGQGEWSRTLEGITGAVFDLAARDNRVIAVGFFIGSFEFQGQTFTSESPADGFALAFTGGGQERWGLRRPGLLRSVDIDNRGGVLVAGSVETQPDARLFIARYLLRNGREDWSRGFNEFPSAVDSSVNRRGEIAVTGNGLPYIIQFGR
jgi:hypothetical protein